MNFKLELELELEIDEITVLFLCCLCKLTKFISFDRIDLTRYNSIMHFYYAQHFPTA